MCHHPFIAGLMEMQQACGFDKKINFPVGNTDQQFRPLPSNIRFQVIIFILESLTAIQKEPVFYVK